MKQQRISILGCGWLGLPLARILVSEGYLVKGSTTSIEKIPVLEKAGIFCFLATLEKVAKNSQQAMVPDGSYLFKGDNIKDFFDADILIITLPFRRTFVDPYEYQKQISCVLSECRIDMRIIFTGSTSVYPDQIKTASEDLEFIADNDRSKVLRGIENDILKRNGVVVRFAGLYGADRKIGAFLAGKKDLIDGPVNLIHQDDAVNILLQIIIKNIRGEIFNACSDCHPMKKELYTAAAKRMGLPSPQFLENGKGATKIVVNDKVKNILGYQFLHPDPLKDII